MRPTTAPRSSTLVIFEVRPDWCAFHDQFGHGHCGVAACSVAMTDLHSFADDVRGLLIVLFVQRRHVESRRWIFWQMSHQTGRGLGWPSPAAGSRYLSGTNQNGRCSSQIARWSSSAGPERSRKRPADPPCFPSPAYVGREHSRRLPADLEPSPCPAYAALARDPAPSFVQSTPRSSRAAGCQRLQSKELYSALSYLHGLRGWQRDNPMRGGSVPRFQARWPRKRG
jgi:hypothetical protein